MTVCNISHSQSRFTIGLISVVFLCFWAQVGHAQQPQDLALRSGVMLLRQSAQSSRGSQPSFATLALTQLGDPTLKPLFEQMLRSGNPAMIVYGQLGLAYSDPEHRLDLDNFTQLSNPAIQAQTLTAAMELDLLNPQQAKELLTIPNLEIPIKMLVATKLVGQGDHVDTQLLRQAVDSENLARKGLATLLMVQQGDEPSLQALDPIDQSSDPNRDQIRQMMLKAVLGHNLNRAAPWAVKICSEQKVDPDLLLLALRTALRFGQDGAVELWQQQFTATTNPADRMRLAMLALYTSPWVNPRLFDAMVNDSQPLIQKIGRAGVAVSGRSQVSQPLTELAGTGYEPAIQWTLDYVQKHASVEDAQAILAGMITSFTPEENRLSQQINDLASAVQVLVERCDQGSSKVLLPILQSPESPVLQVRGVLYGLLRCQQKYQPHLIVAGLPAFKDPEANYLILVLLAKSDQTLSESQLDELRLIVRGGGGLPDAIRLQAAWAYLKRMRQTEQAVTMAIQ